MPRVRVSVPDELLKVAAERAEQVGKKLDELYVEAIERYTESTKDSSAGSVRSRLTISRSSPEVVIEIPEELYRRADKAAKRQGKRRHVMYADALYSHLSATVAAAESALDQGHDVPSGAFRERTNRNGSPE